MQKSGAVETDPCSRLDKGDSKIRLETRMENQVKRQQQGKLVTTQGTGVSVKPRAPRAKKT